MTHAILRAASLLVPADLRAEWLAEWRAELWHVAHSNRRPIAFVAGAFRDAFWLRRNSPAASLAFSPSSPLRCIALLAALAAVTFFCAPPASLPVAGLLTISAAGHPPSVSYDAYRSIAEHASRAFSGIAFCQPIRVAVQLAPGRSTELSAAIATPSLADLLEPPAPRNGPAVLLGERAWRRWFASDPGVSGRFIEIGGRPTRIVGVMPSGAWPGLPIDLWLLSSATPAAHAKGIVLARSKSPLKAGRRWWISAPNLAGGWDRFECYSLAIEPPIVQALGLMFAAFLFLPLYTSVQLGEYPATRHSPRGWIRLLRWCFLGLKLALLVPSIYWGMQLAGALLGPPVHAHGLLIGYVLALRWALLDQRRRCPVCLRVLTNPTPIGCPSQTFLEWYGTEFICARGHGLLHVPEILTSCYSSPRWLYLDRSWSSLFSAGARESTS